MEEKSVTLSVGGALDLGFEYAKAGRDSDAITMFRGVLMHEPDNFEAIERLGTSLFNLGIYYEAMFWFWRGRKLGRKNPMALTNYGLCLSQLGHPEEGLPDLQRAAALAEKGASDTVKALVYNNLGNTLERIGRHADALEALDKGIPFDPNDPFPHYNRGVVLIRLNRHREALKALDKSIALYGEDARKVADADAHYNRGMARLMLGDVKGGFEDYEYRLTTTDNVTPNLGMPADKKWHGEPLSDDKKLYVVCEQGLGDTFQFMRFVPRLRAYAKNIVLTAQTAIYPMAKAAFPDMEVRPGQTLIEHGDVGGWVALMSLPHWLGIKSENELLPPWFIPIENERGEKWKAELPPTPFRVGICWAGNFQHKNDHHRSIPLSAFSALFDLPAHFVSVQQMREGEKADMATVQQSHSNVSAYELKDFRDTAAIMLNCDLVISVDTSVAHLAGSLGVPTWVLIPGYSTDWRWQIKRTDSPWYPAMKLYRQPKVGDWKSVLREVRIDLAALASNREAA